MRPTLNIDDQLVMHGNLQATQQGCTLKTACRKCATQINAGRFTLFKMTLNIPLEFSGLFQNQKFRFT
ncbi:hypothetical protein AU255_18315 [Methyloprofundus sedimenti]|uniref:Uncharacterized protein n=1 Tax=Methyloprofundus sedimenti TaxID=1420851 RepID=A0A1V8M1I7_9GAMM|nr:hypothetical protein [Methyloprofundus sedimenti]OQK15424.1 hypothetical protein AU255_18315 [Methyloprofundus sedimenti]